LAVNPALHIKRDDFKPLYLPLSESNHLVPDFSSGKIFFGKNVVLNPVPILSHVTFKLFLTMLPAHSTPLLSSLRALMLKNIEQEWNPHKILSEY